MRDWGWENGIKNKYERKSKLKSHREKIYVNNDITNIDTQKRQETWQIQWDGGEETVISEENVESHHR